ncbi:hypothetical protein PF005_g28327 [Phytophthora fragariae]|uniref:Uncharacterized protein n=2 Tax=Phytophthora fragariae TaxID=53985 RepID=A0A6A3VX34_9STRA|nr:hypothetical protein PF003_g19943 [Phytophthora fragariae]KAE8918431.1 hypothetical protein PF009_g31255 [Phytophthora fragariae]KAE9066820.1 hypothetical protein PF007_g28300 [Phytophthora fragariae]KAE9168552.1 hypothetical protein PF005_g28327 [Phytophthora fragariae]KAE9174909.1 hypothetical protein PF002_g28922 [Phytophthora fragariae]
MPADVPALETGHVHHRSIGAPRPHPPKIGDIQRNTSVGHAANNYFLDNTSRTTSRRSGAPTPPPTKSRK